MRSIAALVVGLAGSLAAQQVDVYRFDVAQRRQFPALQRSSLSTDTTIVTPVVAMRGAARVDYRTTDGFEWGPFRVVAGDYQITDASGTKFVSPTAKTVTVVDEIQVASSMANMMKQFPPGMQMSFLVDTLRVDSLGSGESIAGYRTSRWRSYMVQRMTVAMEGMSISMTSRHESEYWFAQDLSSVINPVMTAPREAPVTDSLTAALARANNEVARRLPEGFVIRMRTRMTIESATSGSTETSVTSEVTNIRTDRADRSLFAVPPDYTVRRVTDILKPPG